jgi:hypothetical protein
MFRILNIKFNKILKINNILFIFSIHFFLCLHKPELSLYFLLQFGDINSEHNFGRISLLNIDFVCLEVIIWY